MSLGSVSKKGVKINFLYVSNDILNFNTILINHSECTMYHNRLYSSVFVVLINDEYINLIKYGL